jgi:Rrf2 family protein
MSLLSRKDILAITAVIDVALYANGRPVSAKMLAARHDLPPRHLEPMLQALVRQGILKGTRGPSGGYELGREQARISAADIIGASTTVEDDPRWSLPASALIGEVIMPALAEAEQAFAAALNRITVAQMAGAAMTDK